MIIRHYIKCSTCDYPHTLRIQVGHNPYQEHTFKCTSCHEDIVVGMDCDSIAISVNVKLKENCEQGSKEGVIVNLSPEFPLPKGDIHRDLAFPSIEHLKRLHQAQQQLGIVAQSFSSLDESREHALNTPGISDLWPIVKKGWSLSLKGLDELSERKLKGYNRRGYSEAFKLNYVLFDLCGHMLMPGKYHLFADASKVTAEIAEKHTNEYRKFSLYYADNIYSENLHRYLEVFTEFFRCYSDFSQTLTFLQHDISLNGDYEASSASFAKTKLFYGNAFETLTSNITTLACLNNILKGRSFDEFESMTLEKYLTINKANRAKPFKDTAPYSVICECLDSTLRNASHHGAIKLSNNGRKVNYKSGGTGADRSISYKEYLDRCNSIMLSCCALLSMELAITF